ncbi:MAG: FxLYD domain-containing protein [Acidimicrobiia bacterium]
MLWYPPESRQPVPAPGPPPPKNGVATAALVVGIIGILLGYVGILLGPVAIGLGVVGYRKAAEDPTLPGRTPALVGSILGGVAIVTGVASAVLFFWMWDSFWDEAGENVFTALDESAQELDASQSRTPMASDVLYTVECAPGDDGYTHVEGTLTNTGDDTRSFEIEIEVGDPDGGRAFPTAPVDDVAPGETADWRASSGVLVDEAPSLDPNVGVVPQPTCEVVDVTERSVTP